MNAEPFCRLSIPTARPLQFKFSAPRGAVFHPRLTRCAPTGPVLSDTSTGWQRLSKNDLLHLQQDYIDSFLTEHEAPPYAYCICNCSWCHLYLGTSLLHHHAINVSNIKNAHTDSQYPVPSLSSFEVTVDTIFTVTQPFGWRSILQRAICGTR